MSIPVRVALFVTTLALVFATAWGAGRAVEERFGSVGIATETPSTDEADEAGSPRSPTGEDQSHGH